MDASVRPQPTPFSNESTPGRRRGEEHPDALGVKRQAAHRHVAIATAGHQVVHGTDFLGRELGRRHSRASAEVAELAGALGSTPGVVPRGREAEHAQSHRERQARPRSGDCGQELRLGGAVWHAGLVQAHSREADQREEKPRERANHLVALTQPEDLGLKLDGVLGDHVHRDDGAGAAAKPAHRG